MFYHIDLFADISSPRLCPLLNGTMKADNGAAEHGGFGNYNAPAGGAGSPV
jgi:transcription initiation factor TFIID subunit 1